MSPERVRVNTFPKTPTPSAQDFRVWEAALWNAEAAGYLVTTQQMQKRLVAPAD